MKIKLLFFFVLLSISTYAQIEQVLEFENIRKGDIVGSFKFGDRFFFKERAMPSFNHLWISDGTQEGTQKVDLATSFDNYYLIEDRCFITSQNILYELNATDYSITMVTSSIMNIEKVILLNEQIFMLSSSWNLSFVHRFDPTQNSLDLIFNINDRIDAIVKFNDQLLWSYDVNLVMSDGTPEGTKTILEGSDQYIESIDLKKGTAIFDQYIFSAKSQIYGEEPWTTDGSSEGTSLLKDLSIQSSLPSHFFKVDGRLFFIAYSDNYNLSLFTTDGTNEATQRLFSLEDQFGIIKVFESYVFNNEVFLEAISPSEGYELWKTDATLSGTKLVKDIWEGAGGIAEPFRTRKRRASNSFLYFQAIDNIHGQELWRSDGTESGTKIVADLSVGADWSNTIPIGAIDQYFYFMREHHDNGYTLYRIDETVPLSQHPTYHNKDYEWFETIGYNFQRTAISHYLLNDQVEVDQLGNIYITGEFRRDYLQFYGSNNYLQLAPISAGIDRNFIASFDNEGQFRWSKELGGHSLFNEQYFTIDSENNIICAGEYQVEGIVDTILMSDPNQRFFLAKFDNNGNLIWKKQGDIGYNANAEVSAIQTDEEDNIYVSGCFTDFSMQLGMLSISSSLSPALFIAKYDKNGNEIWLKQLPYPALSTHGRIKELQIFNGQIYPIYSFGDYATVVPCKSRTFTINIYKLDKNGNLLDEKAFTSNHVTFITDAKFSPNGYLHLLGMFEGDFKLDNNTFSSECYDKKGFLIKLNPDLEKIEAFDFETENIFFQDIDFGSNGSYYLSGRQEFESVDQSDFNFFKNWKNKTFVKKYDKYDQLISERFFQKYHSSFSNDSKPLIAIDNDEKIILYERFSSQFDTLPVSGSNDQQLGLIKFSLDEQPNYPKDEAINSSDIILFPNPVITKIILRTSDEDFQDARFLIFDANGKILGVPTVSYDVGIIKIDVNRLPPGVYFLQIQLGNQQLTKKFVKIE
jgi:ELWxxDGT repeat protein